MTMEDIVRKRHELEDRIDVFIKQIQEYTSLCAAVDTRDLEIVMAKLHDAMTQARDDETRIKFIFKGLLTQSVYAQRRAGKRRTVSLKTTVFGTESLLPEILTRRFSFPLPVTESLATEWSTGNAEKIRMLSLGQANR